MRISLIAWVVGAVALTGAPAAPAQTPELVTDRPDFTESAVVVPHGSVQFEGGFTWEHDADDNWLNLPELLIRWGVAGPLELRFGLPDLMVIDPDLLGAEKDGYGDSSIGAKVAFGSERTGGWDVAVIASASLPTGEADFTSDAVDPSVLLTTGREVAPGWSLGAQVQADWPTIADEREFVWGGTLVAARALGGSAAAFLEVSTSVPEEGQETTLLHHGYTWLVSPLFQLDIHGGIGLSEIAPDVFAGAGFAFRL